MAMFQKSEEQHGELRTKTFEIASKKGLRQLERIVQKWLDDNQEIEVVSSDFAALGDKIGYILIYRSDKPAQAETAASQEYYQQPVQEPPLQVPVYEQVVSEDGYVYIDDSERPAAQSQVDRYQEQHEPDSQSRLDHTVEAVQQPQQPAPGNFTSNAIFGGQPGQAPVHSTNDAHVSQDYEPSKRSLQTAAIFGYDSEDD